MAPAALGSDTGGSIRQPRRFAAGGHQAYYGRFRATDWFVCLVARPDGTFARTVDDGALLLGIISG